MLYQSCIQSISALLDLAHEATGIPHQLADYFALAVGADRSVAHKNFLTLTRVWERVYLNSKSPSHLGTPASHLGTPRYTSVGECTPDEH